jgi:hypothetical protein
MKWKWDDAIYVVYKENTMKFAKPKTKAKILKKISAPQSSVLVSSGKVVDKVEIGNVYYVCSPDMHNVNIEINFHTVDFEMQNERINLKYSATCKQLADKLHYNKNTHILKFGDVLLDREYDAISLFKLGVTEKNNVFSLCHDEGRFSVIMFDGEFRESMECSEKSIVYPYRKCKINNPGLEGTFAYSSAWNFHDLSSRAYQNADEIEISLFLSHMYVFAKRGKCNFKEAVRQYCQNKFSESQLDAIDQSI